MDEHLSRLRRAIVDHQMFIDGYRISRLPEYVSAMRRNRREIRQLIRDIRHWRAFYATA